MFTYEIGFIGAGAMAEAIASGLVESGLYAGEQMILSNRSSDKLQRVTKKLQATAADDNQMVCKNAKIVILAVKPQQFHGIARQFKESLQEGQMLISIMAGITLTQLEEVFGPVAIIRAMPNTPAKIGCGMTGLAPNKFVTDAQMETVQSLFKQVGEVAVIEEKQMDALGAVSGCGPAYFYEMIEAIADGAVMMGIPRTMAYQLAAQTMMGSAKMVLETGLHPAILKDQVTSPGGTTIRGLAVMEEAGVRGILMKTVEAACDYSKKLGEGK